MVGWSTDTRMVAVDVAAWLWVDGRWSQRSRSMGSEAREGMVRGSARMRWCRASVEALDSSPPFWSPHHESGD